MSFNAEKRFFMRLIFRFLEGCLASGAKVLWLCNPHNPVGRAWTREELKKIADLCLRYQVTILSDDVYCGLTYAGKPYTPIASLSQEISYHTITFLFYKQDLIIQQHCAMLLWYQKILSLRSGIVSCLHQWE